jgi:hypothetical protein
LVNNQIWPWGLPRNWHLQLYLPHPTRETAIEKTTRLTSLKLLEEEVLKSSHIAHDAVHCLPTLSTQITKIGMPVNATPNHEPLTPKTQIRIGAHINKHKKSA